MRPSVGAFYHPHLAEATQPGWVRVDLHSHTMWSGDATTTQDELAQAVEDAGIDVLCITDHSTINGADNVSAPADGWVAFAGPFRSFGQMVILNAGSGHYIVLSGLDRVDVTLNQFVLAGEPIGAMGETVPSTAQPLPGDRTGPVLYVEFRKDGASIDPAPWWAKPETARGGGDRRSDRGSRTGDDGEKVRG